MRNINWKVFGLDTKLKGGGESFLTFFAQYRNSTGSKSDLNLMIILPPEVWEQIFSFLDQKDLSSCRFACKLFTNIIYRLPKWRNLYEESLIRQSLLEEETINPQTTFFRRKRPQLFSKRYRIVMTGSIESSRSSVTLRFMKGNEYDPSFGTNRRLLLDGSLRIVEILDNAGQEEYGLLGDKYYRVGDGFVCLYSVNSRSSLAQAIAYRERIMMAQDHRLNKPLFLVAHRDSKENQNRCISQQEGQQLANSWKAKYYEISDKDPMSVENLFIEILREIIDYQTHMEERRKRRLLKSNSRTLTDSFWLKF